MKNEKKWILQKCFAGILIMSMLFSVTACATDTPSSVESSGVSASQSSSIQETDTDNTSEITGSFEYWSCYSGDSATWEEWRVNLYNETYKDQGLVCELQFVPDGAGISNGKLLSAIASGSAPDLIVCDDAANAYSYAANNCFLPLNSYLENSDIDIESFFPGCSDVIYYQDQAYLIPQDSNVVMLYYNLDMVEEAGLDPENPPKTIEELDEWAEKLTVKSSNGGYERLGFIPWQDHGGEAWIMPFFFGADVYDANTNKLDLTSDAMQNYLNWVRSYADKYGIENIDAIAANAGGRSTADHPFYTGKIAMTVTLNSFTHLMDVYGPEDIRYGVSAVPAAVPEREGTTTFTVNVFAVPDGSENVDQALHFVNFCLSAEVCEENYGTWRSIPCIDAEFENVSWTQKGDEIYALERELANSEHSGVPALCSVASELGDAFNTLREGVIYTNADIPSSLESLQEQYQAELDAK